MREIQWELQDAMDHLVESGSERGIQVSVYRDGEQLADVVAGVADPATGRALTADTPIHVTSTAKGLTATVVHILVADGLFGYDTPISELWSEFGAHGKKNATIRHALTHSVGVPAVPANTTPQDLCDWPKMCAIIADATPWWEPGTKTGYHPQTFGYLLGEVVRRATGQPISEVMAERIAGPLGLSRELFFGVPESDLDRVASLSEAPGNVEMFASLPDDFPFFTVAPRAVQPTAEFCNRRDVLRADMPAGGVMSARAIARVYAALLGEVDGVRLLSAQRLREVTTPSVTGVDEVVGFPANRGLGFDIGFDGPLGSPTLFGMVGSGGSAAFADHRTGISVALAKTQVSAGDYSTFHRVSEIVAEAR